MRWLMIGDLQLAHRKPALPFYPEDEKVLPGWKMEGDDRLWAQALWVPVAKTMWAVSMAGWMGGFSYIPMICQGQETTLLVYIHPNLELKLIHALAEPKVLK